MPIMQRTIAVEFCNLRRIVDYERLWGCTRELHQSPGIAETADMAQIQAP